MAFDEASSLEAFVEELRPPLHSLDAGGEILIVDDGSRDRTGEIADRLATDARIRVVHHGANGGLGAVYRTGLAEAAGDYVTFFPADGQFEPAILAAFLPSMADLDLLLGYVDRSDSLAGRVLSAAERLLYRVLLGPLPRFQGVFMVRRAKVERLRLQSKGRGWAIVMELLIRASRSGWRIRSVPIPLRPRRAGRSKVNNVRTVVANLRQVLALRRELSR